ncbi:putative quinol monooxygenase [Aestuariimicrobium ganziense]|uniref:putative quinol monooxygenase n=1 Tax=Aestuariimicrobium ganziense TaxID=2773677 RepID=UPI0019403F1F|nr:putative quinol monooxygenase [Aestuariimicrobium ganziense]
MTINVLAIFHALPEHRDELKRRLEVMAEATHQEEGCLLYALQEGAEDPNVLGFVEKWASEEALAKHLQAPHVREGGEERQAMMSQPGVVIKTYNAAEGEWPAAL